MLKLKNMFIRLNLKFFEYLKYRTRYRVIVSVFVLFLLSFLFFIFFPFLQSYFFNYVEVIESLLSFFLLFIFLLTVFLNSWVLFFNIRSFKSLIILVFPSLILIVNYLLFNKIFLQNFLSDFEIFQISLYSVFFNYFLIVLFFCIYIALLSYILFLTANILIGSTFMNIPLEQAGKAVLFILSHFAFYLYVVFFQIEFIDYFNIFQQFFSIFFVSLYFSFLSTLFNKENNLNIIFFKSLFISLILSSVFLILLIWPITSIYKILGISIFYYILLNTSLETRRFIPKITYLEYFFILAILVILFFIISEWGIINSITF